MSGGKAAFFSTVEDSAFQVGALSKAGSASLKTMPKLVAEGRENYLPRVTLVAKRSITALIASDSGGAVGSAPALASASIAALAWPSASAWTWPWPLQYR
jgi:hypothetical protein